MLNRRRWLRAGVSAGVASFVPARVLAAPEPLRLSAFGGFFANSLRDSVVKAFTAETGVAVEVINQPGGDEWLFGLVRAARAGLAPVDLSIFVDEGLGRLRANGTDTPTA